jgi:hypothetical protein
MTVLVPSPLVIEGWFAIVGLLIVLLRATPAHAGKQSVTTATRVDALALTSIALITAGVYAWTASFYFLSDDFVLLRHAYAPLNWRVLLATPGGDGSYRPIGHLSYMLTAKWAATDPASWHWIGIVLHAANALLVFMLAAALGWSRLAAWLAAVLFTLHGTRPEAAVWMAGRYDLLATFFFLIATVSFVRSWEARDARRILYQSATCLAMLAAILSKESAYASPLIATLLVACFAPEAARRARATLAVFWILAAALFAYRWSLFHGIGGYGGFSLPALLKALTFRIWSVLFFPINWTISPGIVLAVLVGVYAVALAALFSLRAPRRRLLFAVSFVILAALPAYSQLLIGIDLEKSRVLYLPSIGFCLLLAALAENAHPKLRAGIATAVILFHAAALLHNLSAWDQASRVVRSACIGAATCPDRLTVVSGLPRTINGVYTFANGFPECVAMQGAGARAPVRLEAGESAAMPNECRFRWDSKDNVLTRAR